MPQSAAVTLGSRLWGAGRRLLADPLILGCVLGLLSVLVHLPVLSNDFVFDDIPAIADNPVVTGAAPWSSVFTENFWGGRPGYEHVTTWRPLTTLGLRLNWAVSGGSPAAFHLVNLLLHGVCVALVCLLFARLFDDRRVGFVAGALFAVLPVHVEAIAGAVNRAELQTAAFYLAGLYVLIGAWERGSTARYLSALGLFALALLSKEHGVTWPAAAAVVLAWLYTRDRENPGGQLPSLAIHAATAITIGGYLLARGAVLPSLLGGDIPPADNPMVSLDFFGRLGAAGIVYFHYLRLLVAPLRLSADYSAYAIDVSDPTSSAAMAGWLLIAASLYALRWALRRQPRLAVCLGLFAVLYGLVSNLFLLNTILLAERLMYLPSVAWCGLLGVVGAAAWSSTDRRAIVAGLGVAFSVVLIGYGAHSMQRTKQWRSDLTLFQSSVDAFGGSVRANVNLGHALLGRGLVSKAHNHFWAARAIAPHDPDVQRALGDLAWRRGLADKSIPHYESSFQVRPQRVVLARLCRSLVAAGRLDDGLVRCRQAAELLPDNAMVWHHLGMARARTGDRPGALDALRRAARIEPNHPGILRSLAELGEG